VIPSVIVPRAERLEPIRIPSQVRAHLEENDDLGEVTSIVRYESVEIRIGDPIVGPTRAPADKRERVRWIRARTRQAMVELQSRAG